MARVLRRPNWLMQATGRPAVRPRIAWAMALGVGPAR